MARSTAIQPVFDHPTAARPIIVPIPLKTVHVALDPVFVVPEPFQTFEPELPPTGA